MKRIYSLILFATTLAFVGCVDDYTESNDPHLLDAPALTFNADGETAKIVYAGNNKYTAFIQYGESSEITVSVIKAKGKIGDITVTSSITEFGTVALDETSVAAVKGKESGDFKFTFTPADFPAGTDRALNVTITVADEQVDSKGEASPLTTSMTIPVTLVSGPCLSDALIAGTYYVTETTSSLDGGEAVTLADLKANSEGIYTGENIPVVIAMLRPGMYTVTEVTGGLLPLEYAARSKPAVRINLCGNVISGRTGYLTFGKVGSATNPRVIYTVDGTVNEDGTITITWSYEGVNIADTPVDPAHGTYKLVRIG